tara:strand:+ start:140 stop:1042 length:903 start_codon:yes stop_codon:yes gene_type:complete
MIILTNCCGFFSNFFKVLNWELENKDDKVIVPYFISRSTTLLIGAQPWNMDKTIYPEKENIWELMFCPIREYNKIELNDNKNIFTWDYPKNDDWESRFPSPLNQIKWGYIFCDASIYSNPLFSEIRKVYHNCYKKFIWTSYLKEHIESNLKIISNPEKTVAVFIRSGQHFNKYNYIEDIIEELKVVMKNYDKLFLVTTVMPFIEKITTVFGDKVCFLSDKNMTKNDNDDWGCYRTNPNSPWIMKNIDYKKECIQCFTDVYLASTCDKILGGSSNMFLGALIINPSIKFKILDVFKNINGS